MSKPIYPHPETLFYPQQTTPVAEVPVSSGVEQQITRLRKKRLAREDIEQSIAAAGFSVEEIRAMLESK